MNALEAATASVLGIANLVSPANPFKVASAALPPPSPFRQGSRGSYDEMLGDPFASAEGGLAEVASEVASVRTRSSTALGPAAEAGDDDYDSALDGSSASQVSSPCSCKGVRPDAPQGDDRSGGADENDALARAFNDDGALAQRYSTRPLAWGRMPLGAVSPLQQRGALLAPSRLPYPEKVAPQQLSVRRQSQTSSGQQQHHHAAAAQNQTTLKEGRGRSLRSEVAEAALDSPLFGASVAHDYAAAADSGGDDHDALLLPSSEHHNEKQAYGGVDRRGRDDDRSSADLLCDDSLVDCDEEADSSSLGARREGGAASFSALRSELQALNAALYAGAAAVVAAADQSPEAVVDLATMAKADTGGAPSDGGAPAVPSVIVAPVVGADVFNDGALPPPPPPTLVPTPVRGPAEGRSPSVHAPTGMPGSSSSSASRATLAPAFDAAAASQLPSCGLASSGAAHPGAVVDVAATQPTSPAAQQDPPSSPDPRAPAPSSPPQARVTTLAVDSRSSPPKPPPSSGGGASLPLPPHLPPPSAPASAVLSFPTASASASPSAVPSPEAARAMAEERVAVRVPHSSRSVKTITSSKHSPVGSFATFFESSCL